MTAQGHSYHKPQTTDAIPIKFSDTDTDNVNVFTLNHHELAEWLKASQLVSPEHCQVLRGKLYLQRGTNSQKCVQI